MKNGKIALSIILTVVFALNIFAGGPLTFEERVKAQEAIERVYYSHRIWPKENPQPKPLFEKMVSKEQIEAKVNDYLKKCAALDQFWQRPIVASQLQAEMERMAKGTKDPQTLNELFAALNNDPYLIAECLARPVLADRLIHNWYTNDERFHKEAREKAEEAAKILTPENFASLNLGEYSTITYKLESENEEALAGNPEEQGDVIRLSRDEWENVFSKYPKQGEISSVVGSEQAFTITHTILTCDDEIQVKARSFPKKSFSEWWQKENVNIENKKSEMETDSFAFSPPRPEATCDSEWIHSGLYVVLEARNCHAAVWTGTEMIIWGGCLGQQGATRSGGRYNPSTDTWVEVSQGTNCPIARTDPTAIWTGTEMIVWGGSYYKPDYTGANTGGRYNPSTDTWLPTTTTNAPSGRYWHAAVWTGTEMIIWGGYYAAGGRYNPSSDSWTATSTGSGCPGGYHYRVTAVWTGTKMIVWGGYDHGTVYKLTGGCYDPSTDSWTATSTLGCPSARAGHTAVWTGSVMVIWGGWDKDYNRLQTGCCYDPNTNSWTPTSTGTNCPSGRSSHTAIWTGREMVIWGGVVFSPVTTYFNNGGKYDPSSGTWAATSTSENCPPGRNGHTAVWTGTEMIVWGGSNGYSWYNYLSSGGRYNPSTDSWIPAASSTGGNPSPRSYSSGIWTGAEMIVWGGNIAGAVTNSGLRYDPALDQWTTCSTGANCPSARQDHSAVWTGTEMIVWGGYNASCTNTGGRYNPVSESWAGTSTGENCPTARRYHTAVWTGTKMIIWGGYDGSSYPDVGGQYDASMDSWTTTALGPSWPEGRQYHTAVWTGTEMIIWGGRYGSGSGIYPTTAGRFSPSLGRWIIPTATGAPSARAAHTAVWTGTEMIVWGGSYNTTSQYFSSGGRYNPTSDTWTATSTGTNCPSQREKHSAIWTGTGMIVWGGNYSSWCLQTGGRYNPSANTWTTTTTGNYCPEPRSGHAAAWTGSEMMIWGGGLSGGGIYSPPPAVTGTTPGCYGGNVTLSTDSYSGYQWLKDGSQIDGATGQNCLATENGNYSVRITRRDGCTVDSSPYAVSFLPLPTPTVEGNSTGCIGVGAALSTQSFSSYQWIKDSSDIGGANGQSYNATESGSYSVRVTDTSGCAGTSTTHDVTISPGHTPAISGPDSGCGSVNLSTDAYSTYQWKLNGSNISGATSQSYDANVSGNYAVEVTTSDGCQGISSGKSVSIIFCSTSEVSPKFAVFPSKIKIDPGSSTGYYLYFQKIDGADGYKIYQGDMVAPWDGSYHHAGQPGNLCSATVNDLTTGEMRAEITPSAGNHYYLVTAYSGAVEGPSGYDSADVEIPKVTCSP